MVYFMRRKANTGYVLMVIILAGAFFAYESGYLDRFFKPDIPDQPQETPSI